MAVVTLFPSNARPDTRVRGFEWRPHAIGDAIDFGDAQMPDEHAEILALRLRAHQHYGHLPGYMAADLASPFDAYARHLVCRSKGRIVGYVRLIHKTATRRRASM
jgi:hypothetical protein